MSSMFGLTRVAVRFLLVAPALAVGLDNGVAGAVGPTATFDEYIKAHGRSYQPGTAEYGARRLLYEARTREIDAHNRKHDRMWTAGVNIMSDRTDAEMKELNGYRSMKSEISASSSFIEALEIKSSSHDIGYKMPQDHSWVSVDIDGDKKEERVEALANIRSQSCGNCWAKSTNAMLEAHRQLHGGVVASFNDDELTECSENVFNCGGSGHCGGSTPELAIMHYVKNGLLLDPDAGAQAANTTSGHAKMRGTNPQAQKRSCPKMADIVDKSELPPHEINDGVRISGEDSPAKRFDMIGWEKLPENHGWPIMLALYERGPVAVALATSGWEQYKSGVYGGCKQNANIGHSVLAIGFGQVEYQGSVVKYWTLQNSWGPSFGENGHFRLMRHDLDDEFCGTDSSPQAGTGCDGGPASVKICGMCGVLYDALVPYFVPQTWLAKNLQELRRQREAARRKRSGRRPSHQMVAVDGEGGIVPTAGEAETVPHWLPSWMKNWRFCMAVLIIVLLGISIGCYRCGNVASLCCFRTPLGFAGEKNGNVAAARKSLAKA